MRRGVASSRRDATPTGIPFAQGLSHRRWDGAPVHGVRWEATLSGKASKNLKTTVLSLCGLGGKVTEGLSGRGAQRLFTFARQEAGAEVKKLIHLQWGCDPCRAPGPQSVTYTAHSTVPRPGPPLSWAASCSGEVITTQSGLPPAQTKSHLPCIYFAGVVSAPNYCFPTRKRTKYTVFG